jgi:uncharacterized protein YjgD (DUF1641 family)
MGKSLEQQRQAEIPIATMRSEMAKVGLVQVQKNKANALMEEFSTANPDKPFPPALLAKIHQLDPSTATSALAANTERSRIASEQSTRVGTGVAQAGAQVAFSDKLYKTIPIDIDNPSSPANVTGPAELKKDLIAVASKIPGTTPEQLNTMQIGDLQDFVHNNQIAQRAASLEDRSKAGQAVLDTNSNLQNIAEIRKAVDAPGVAKILDSNKGADIVSILTNYFANQSPENAANYARTMAQIKAAHPDDYRAFEILAKKLNENVVVSRSLLSNPSNSATSLLASGRPSIANTQDAMRAMLEALERRSASGLSSRWL